MISIHSRIPCETYRKTREFGNDHEAITERYEAGVYTFDKTVR